MENLYGLGKIEVKGEVTVDREMARRGGGGC